MKSNVNTQTVYNFIYTRPASHNIIKKRHFLVETAHKFKIINYRLEITSLPISVVPTSFELSSTPSLKRSGVL